MRGLLSARAGGEGACRLDSCVAADDGGVDVHYNNALAPSLACGLCHRKFVLPC